MATVDDLIKDAVVRDLTCVVLASDRARSISGATAVESVSDIDRAASDMVVVLSDAATEEAVSFQLELAIRIAGARNVAALVLQQGGVEQLSSGAQLAAERFGITILRATTAESFATLLVVIDRLVSAEAAAALERVHRTLARSDSEATESLPDLVSNCGRILGATLTLIEREPPASLRATPVVVDGREIAWIATGATADGYREMAIDIAVKLLAARVADRMADEIRTELESIHSVSEVLSELIADGDHAAPATVRRARSLGLQLDGFHVVVWLGLDSGPDKPVSFATREAARTAALKAVATEDANNNWHLARSGVATLLVRSFRREPSQRELVTLTSQVQASLEATMSLARECVLSCGIGGSHPGPGGLMASAAEGRAAAAVALASPGDTGVVSFDSTGLRRAVVEWYSSRTAQEIVQSVLRPLESLGAKKSATAIATLRAFLDNQGSISKTADELHLHRNAVTYRITRIAEQLDVDLNDADDRLLLQLACRARGLG
jgi:sugar diacid utilization regulator